MDLLAPSTDAGVAAQFVIWFGVLTAAAFATRKNADLRLLVIGVGILGTGMMAVRAIH